MLDGSGEESGLVVFEMKSFDEMKKQADTMPVGQWFSLDEIMGDVHSPELWQYLYNRADGFHIRESDGAVLYTDDAGLRYVWQKE
jgi:hypothetical protein